MKIKGLSRAKIFTNCGLQYCGASPTHPKEFLLCLQTHTDIKTHTQLNQGFDIVTRNLGSIVNSMLDL